MSSERAGDGWEAGFSSVFDLLSVMLPLTIRRILEFQY